MPEVQTIVILEIAADSVSWEAFEHAFQSLQTLKGVEHVALQRRSAPAFTNEHWATLAIGLRGSTKASLRRLYQRVSKLARQPPLRLTGRSCTLNDMCD